VLSEPLSATIIYGLFDESDARVRGSARRALSVILGEAATAYLTALLLQSIPQEKAAYMDALVFRGSVEVASEIAKFLDSSDIEMKLWSPHNSIIVFSRRPSRSSFCITLPTG
jgi:hypothetical protein